MRELLREQDMLAELARRAFARAGLKRTPTSSDRQQVELWCSDWCMNSELILYAAELASKKSTPFAEMKGCFRIGTNAESYRFLLHGKKPSAAMQHIRQLLHQRGNLLIVL